jgi:hypothetical protein
VDTSSAVMTSPAAGYRHEAFLYRSPAEFIAGVLTFVRGGVADGERVMVALAEPRLSLVRTALGVHGDSVHFMDMAAVGAIPPASSRPGCALWRRAASAGARPGA